MGLLQALEQVGGGLLGFHPQQSPTSGGILAYGPNGEAVSNGANTMAAQNAGAAPATVGAQYAPGAQQGPPVPGPGNPILGAVDHLLFGGAFGAAQNDALRRRQMAYQTQQLVQYGLSLPPDQQGPFFADPQGYIKGQEEIMTSHGKGTKLSDTSVMFGGPRDAIIVQAPNQGINAQTNRPYYTAPSVTDLGTGQATGGGFQAGSSLGTGAPTASNGLVLGTPTDQYPTGVIGSYAQPQIGAPGSVAVPFTTTFSPNGQPAAQANDPTQSPAPPAPPTGPVNYQPPVNAPITSGFGPRQRPIAGATADHKGIDYGVPVGTPVKAAADGTVIAAGPHGGFGNAVTIRHGDGTTTLYGHLSGVNVQPGQQVKGGQPIGASGATGTVTGPNLHYAHYGSDGKPMNPLSPQAASAGAQQGALGGGFGTPHQLGNGPTIVPKGDPRYASFAPGTVLQEVPGKGVEVVQTPTAAGNYSDQDKARMAAIASEAEAANQYAAQARQFVGSAGKSANPLYAIPGADMVGAALDPKFRSLENLGTQMATTLRAPGMRMTQMEFKKFGEVSPSVENTTEANAKIADQAVQLSQWKQQKASFYQDWIAKNGNLNGADSAWDQHEAQVLGGQAGKPASAPAPSGPRLSPQQAQMLPKGSSFVGLDGITRVRQ